MKLIHIYVQYDEIGSSGAIYDADHEQYIWGPKSKTWGHFKVKYKPISKKGVSFGHGYGLLKVDYEHHSETIKLDGDPYDSKYEAKCSFITDIQDLIYERVTKIGKTGLLRISGLPIREMVPKEEAHFEVSFGLTFTPMPLSALVPSYSGYLSLCEYCPNWIIKRLKDTRKKKR